MPEVSTIKNMPPNNHSSHNAPTSKSDSRFRFSLRTFFITITISTVLLGGIFIFVRYIEQTFERGVLDAYRVWGAGDLLVDYMRANNDAWPRNWEDIESFMADKGDHYTVISDFEDLRRHIEIDFSFDPSTVDTSVEFDELQPSFRVAWLRNGSDIHYQGSGPNEIVFRYLQNR